MDLIKSDSDIIKQIDNLLGDFNKTQVDYNSRMDYLPLNFHIKDDTGALIAGINSFSCWQMLYLSEFWVKEEYRGQGLGTRLLKKVETEAKHHGTLIVQTDTFDWQAKDFYLKFGYKVFGVIDNCPKGHQRFYLKKVL